MKLLTQLLPIVVLMISVSCTKPENSFRVQTELAHAKPKFMEYPAIKFDIDLSFGGKERLRGSLTLLTHSGKGLIQKNDGSEIVFINDDVYCSPELKNTKGVRFDAFTWAYFFLLPYKLSDEGVNLDDYKENTLNGQIYKTQCMTFDAGTGDAPDDWYILYANSETHLLENVAYIVTYNSSKDLAEQDPHAIQYGYYSVVDGVPFATQWTFVRWNKKSGMTDTLGSASLTNIQFTSDTGSSVFDIPNNYVKVKD